MSTAVNKARVGIFVVGALTLFVVGLVILGGKNLFSNDIDYVLYFDGSVSGLNIGAPVVFRGVPLGNVTKINLVANVRDEGVTIPVHIRIDEGSIVRLGSRDMLTDAMREELIQRMVQRGLRARLQLQSFITGQYRVELDFFPDTPARYHSNDHDNEIPTVPSQLDEFQRALAKMPLESIATALNTTLDGISRLVSKGDVQIALGAMREAFEQARDLLESMKPLREDARKTLTSFNQTAVTMDKQLPEAMASFQLAMNGIAAAAGQMQRTLASAGGVVSRDSRTIRDFTQALKEFTAAARAVRSLATMLEQHPEALLRGKGGNRP